MLKFRSLAILILLGETLFAQQNFVHYTVNSGLPQSQVTTLFHDSKGYIYIGTKGGFSVYYGLQFKNFTINDGLYSGHITAFLEAKNGTMWVLSSNCLHKLEHNTLTAFKPPFQCDFGNYGDNFRIAEDDNGTILLLNFTPERKHQILKFKNGTDSVYFQSDSLRYGRIFWYEGKILFFDETNFYTFDGNSVEQILKTQSYTGLHRTNYGLFTVTNNRTIGRFENDSVQHCVKTQFDINIISEYERNKFLYFILPDNLRLADSDSDTQIAEIPNITALLVDKEQIIWAGSENGLYRIVDFENFSETETLVPYIWGIVEDNQNRIWFASCSGGLSMFENEQFTKYPQFDNYNFYMDARKLKNGNILLPHGKGTLEFDGKKIQRNSVFKQAQTV